ncbi:50S ribosomal protein L7/L12 [Clostridium estertheticum]|uniref:50S ribosomal protein L7/L12 n=1 Tax=Clostridium estertheticum TaxID=238834 RepID=UPI0013EEE5F1|nr:50S ribosomal protein L7/L12 [Clostridium estertheticum]MBZ9609431.1 50S ribosomal protein L7/L12 [Clostridium estertheticum]
MSDTFVLGLIGAGVVLTVSSIVNTISMMRIDIAQMNRTLSMIADKVGVPSKIGLPGEMRVSDETMAELKSLILEGKNIKAIKKYRMATGIGLIEGKDYIDALSEKELK